MHCNTCMCHIQNITEFDDKIKINKLEFKNVKTKLDNITHLYFDTELNNMMMLKNNQLYKIQQDIQTLKYEVDNLQHNMYSKILTTEIIKTKPNKNINVNNIY